MRYYYVVYECLFRPTESRCPSVIQFRGEFSVYGATALLFKSTGEHVTILSWSEISQRDGEALTALYTDIAQSQRDKCSLFDSSKTTEKPRLRLVKPETEKAP